jgi:hypothetical protein
MGWHPFSRHNFHLLFLVTYIAEVGHPARYRITANMAWIFRRHLAHLGFISFFFIGVIFSSEPERLMTRKCSFDSQSPFLQVHLPFVLNMVSQADSILMLNEPVPFQKKKRKKKKREETKKRENPFP